MDLKEGEVCGDLIAGCIVMDIVAYRLLSSRVTMGLEKPVDIQEGRRSRCSRAKGTSKVGVSSRSYIGRGRG
jgi:hypothetical protein